MAAAAAADASEARVAAAKYMLDEMVGSRVEQAALRQTFSAKIRTYDELTSSQVRGRERSGGRGGTHVLRDGAV